MRYLEDIETDETLEVGSYTVTEEEIVSFAEQFDPQPFHVDPEQARESLFDGIVASGWHTVAICNKLFIEEYWNDTAGQGGRNITELQWRRPVRPGDSISLQIEVLEKTVAEHDSDIGNVTIGMTGVNQDGETVVSWIGTGMIGLKPDS